MLATVAAADSANVQKKVQRFYIYMYSEAEPQAKYAIYKQTRTLCVLQLSTLYKRYIVDCTITQSQSTSTFLMSATHHDVMYTLASGMRQNALHGTGQGWLQGGICNHFPHFLK